MIDERPLSILVVEPHAKFRTLVSRRLEADGHQITDVSTANLPSRRCARALGKCSGCIPDSATFPGKS